MIALWRTKKSRQSVRRSKGGEKGLGTPPSSSLKAKMRLPTTRNFCSGFEAAQASSAHHNVGGEAIKGDLLSPKDIAKPWISARVI